jgi:PAS domain S-box-containing protein
MSGIASSRRDEGVVMEETTAVHNVEPGSSEELAQLLLNSTGEGIYGIDLDGNCTFANPACLKLLGFDKDSDILGQQMHKLVHHTRESGEPYAVEECRIYQALRDCEGTHADDEIMFCSDGTAFPAEYWSYPIIRDGELAGCVVTFVDITERRKAENELRAKESLVSSLLASTGEGIYGVDLDGNCTFANPACLKLLGVDSDSDVLGKHMHNLAHHTRANGAPYPVEECRIYQALREREGTHVDDEVMFCSDGTSFPAEYWSYPIMRDGRLSGCVVTFVDISGRLKAEEELRQTEKMAALGKLSAGLAHELNNPASAAGRASSQLLDALGELQGATVDLTRAGIDHELWASLVEWDRALQRGSEGPETLSAIDASDREEELMDWLDDHGVADGWDFAPTLVAVGIRAQDLDKIASTLPRHALANAIGWLCKSFTTQDLAEAVVKSSRSISRLVDAAKSFSYMDQDTIQNVDVHQGLEDTVTILGERLTGRIEVVRDYDQDLPTVHVRGSELNQVWLNLIDNAVDALGGGGTVTLRTFLEGDHLAVEIADDGPGIPLDHQHHVFDPFFTTKEVGEGTGLGLDVARRVVTTRCDGQIGLRSQPGETVFWVHLPIAHPTGA